MRSNSLPSPTKLLTLLLTLAVVLSACSPAANAGDTHPKIIATTTIVGDVVAHIGGDLIDLTILLPVNADPHAFEPTPRDMATIEEADLIFANGAGLEAFLGKALGNTETLEKVVEVSAGFDLRQAQHPEEDPDHEGGDPHVWFDPHLVGEWVIVIEQALTKLDPAHQADFKANAGQYRLQLADLDGWIQTQIASIPAERRVIVSDHDSFGYLADRYGLTQVGIVFPGFSTLSSPSAQELANLENAIQSQKAPAIFVGKTINPALAEQIARDTGIQLVFLYTGSLSEKDGPAATYLEFMRYNVNAIVSALK